MKFLFVVVLVGIVWFFVSKYEKKKKGEQTEHKEALESINAHFSYIPEQEQLVVRERCPDNAKVFRIQNYQKKAYSDVPAKLVYTGATVGGVTTGGVHIEGGYTAVTKGSQSDKCLLQYVWYEGDKLCKGNVKTISFGKGITYSGSVIAKYVSGRKLMVVNNQATNRTASSLAGLGMSAHSATTLNAFENSNVKDYPTKEKCLEIVSWLCGVD